MNTLEQLNDLTLSQLRALASQHKVPFWNVESRNYLLRKLTQVSEETKTDLLKGQCCD